MIQSENCRILVTTESGFEFPMCHDEMEFSPQKALFVVCLLTLGRFLIEVLFFEACPCDGEFTIPFYALWLLSGK
jgi:hypothetical protein